MTIKIFAIVPDTSTEQEGSFKVADSDYRVPEGTTAMYAAFAIDPATGSPRASQPGGLVNITFTDGSAKTADNDYSADNRQLALGQIFTAEALDDYVADNNESFNVSVSRFTNEASFSSVTYINAVTVIVDDSNPDTPDTPDEPNQEVVLVRIAGPATVIEGNTTTNYTVTLTETPVTDVTVKLTYTGTATDGTDYTKEVSVVVPAGSKTATFDLATIDDVYADNGETIIVTLGQITGGGFESIKADPTKDSVTTTILDDSNPDTPDTPDEPNQEVVLVSIAGPATVIEGNTTTNYTVTLTETPVTDVTVKLTYTGTATDGTDYTKEVSVVVPAGSKTATFDLATIDDVYADNGETIIVTLGQITGGGFESIKADPTKDSVTTTILDDSNPDTPDTPDEPNQEVVLVSIAGPATVFEGNTTTNYTVSLTETPLTAVTVKLTYTGTATDGTDYTKDVQVTVPAGSKTATFDLATIVDTIPDNGETIIVTLGQITGGGFEDIRANTTANTVTTTILDAPIEYTFKLFAANGDGVPLTDGNGNYVSASQVNEDAANGPTSAHYVVLAVDGSGAPLSGQPSGTVGIGFNNNTAEAEDYTGAVSRAEIGKVFTATATDDVLADNGETFVVSLVGGYSGTETVFYDPSKVTTTILDETDNDQDDPPPPNDNDSAYTFKLFASDAQGNIVTTASTINEEGQTSAYYVVKAVDAFGNVLTTNQPPTGTVEVSFTNNGSTSDGDYTKSVTTTAAIGSAFSSTAINDALPDNGETFTVRLVGNYRGAAAYEAVTYDPATVTTTITDADLPALQLQAYIQVADAGAGTVSYGGHNWAKVGSIGEESNTQATYTVLALDATGTPRVSQPGGDVTISYAAGTPPAEGGGVDYTAPTTSVALGGTFNATAFNDAFPDSGEKFTISVTDLTTKSNYATVGFGDAVTTTITDADLPALQLQAYIQVADAGAGTVSYGGHNWAKVGSIGEESNTQATYTVLALDATGTPRVSQPGGDVTISYAAGTPPAEGGGVDYTAPTTSVALGGTFNATAFNDAFPDSGEKFTISVTDLTTKSNYATVGFGDAVTTTITDADLPAPSLKAWSDVVQSDQGELDQGDNTAKTFTVTQQQLSNQADANNKWFDGGIGTMLAEGQSLASVANQYAPRDITLAFTAPVTFTFINEVGDYHSVIGWYNKNEPGVGHVVWADAGVGSSSFTTPTPMPQGTDLGFFMISNGSPPNNVSIPETVYFKGGVAYTEPDGAGTLLKSAGGSNQVWFSNNPNGDGQQHVVTGLDADDKSLLYVGFEDLNNGGDKDYNDVVFKVDLGDANKLIADPVTFDLGVDIDDRSALLGHVTVAFDLGLNDEVFFGSVAGLQVSGPVVNPGTGFTTYTIDNALNPSDLINAGDAEDLLDSFKILVGNTSPSGEYANVDYADRTAEVRMFSAEVDALGQAIELGDPAHAIFQLVKDQNNPV
ncbi:MAG: DUF4114 domain-containing protein [Rhodoferax sp.]|nr:DUF4114 domain-containing protein [Rhodoferax sp.]